MNAFAIALLSINVILLLSLPRRWAPLPLLISACYIAPGQGVLIGPFHFTFIRLIMAVGFIRVLMRREKVANGFNLLDAMILIAAVWAVFSSFFHNDPGAALIFRLGFLYNTCGIYFLLRIFCRNFDEVAHLCKVAAVLLIPVALEMIFEKVAEYNLFSALGGTDRTPAIRMGRIRASGPFAHAILAGTVGAVCLPLMIGLWKHQRSTSILGIAACLMMIVSCASSGPILSGLAALMALFFWPLRGRMKTVCWLAFLGYIALDIVMKAPAYYILGRIDVTGGSTGWHRAKLIESAIDHLGEWWFAGTDYTRHWMPTGVSWSPDHTDITNHYLQMGVIGGLPLTLLFIGILVAGFSIVGRRLKQSTDLSVEQQFFVWSLGASLFAHAATCISVSYFDQSFVFLYLTLAAIGSLSMQREPVRAAEREPLRVLSRWRRPKPEASGNRPPKPLRVTKRILPRRS